MCFVRLKRCLCVFVAVALTIGALFFVRALHVDTFFAQTGKRTYYLDATTSGALQTGQLQGLDIVRVRGESILLDGEANEEKVQEILDTYRAKVQFIERVDGITSYYAYAPTCGACIFLGGVPVNLHIALSKNGCVVGTPIIFGGY